MHETFMLRALDLARIPASTSPNPRVGAVLVRDEQIVGEGFHEGPGTPHAEAKALEMAGARANGATLYVNLEPCNFHGRTPPCAPAVVEAGVSHVVVAIEDPDVRVSGGGLALLRDAGLEVTVGVLEANAREVNRAFIHHRVTGRPLVSLKLALTLDGRMGAPDRTSRWITGEAARRRVHERRAEVDAVIVGAATALNDDPQLTARDVPVTRQPVRVVVDAAGHLPSWARVFDEGTVVVATTSLVSHDAQLVWKETGAEIVTLPAKGRGVDLGAMIESFVERGWMEVLCEGGAELATSLLRDDLVDRIELHQGPIMVGRGGPEIGDIGVETMSEGRSWSLVRVDRADQDVIAIYDRVRD